MAVDTVVHLIITGIIALQPMDANETQWRVLVPDMTANAHEAHVLVASDDLVSKPTGAGKLMKYPLKEATGRISNVTRSGNPGFPQELLTLAEACSTPAGECAQLAPPANLNPAAALDLIVDEAGLASTWFYPEVDWYLERSKGSPRKRVKGSVAEEVCLTFKVPSMTFKLMLVNAAGTTTEIDLKRNAKGWIELQLENVMPDSSTNHENEDPHFRHYYDMTLRHSSADVARLKNDQKADGTAQTAHDHWISAQTIAMQDVSIHGGPKKAPGKAPIGILSTRGSNCPPIGAPSQ